MTARSTTCSSSSLGAVARGAASPTGSGCRRSCACSRRPGRRRRRARAPGSASWNARCAPHASSTTSGTPCSCATALSAAHVGDRAEVGRRDDDRAGRAGVAASARVERLRRRGSARCRAPESISGATNVGRSPDRTSPSTVLEWTLRCTTTLVAGLRERQAGGVVALRGPVDQEPGARRAPRLGRELLRLLEGSRLGPCVDALGERRDVQRQRAFAERLEQRRSGRRCRPCGRARGSGRRAGGVRAQRVEIRRLHRPASEGRHRTPSLVTRVLSANRATLVLRSPLSRCDRRCSETKRLTGRSVIARGAGIVARGCIRRRGCGDDNSDSGSRQAQHDRRRQAQGRLRHPVQAVRVRRRPTTRASTSTSSTRSRSGSGSTPSSSRRRSTRSSATSRRAVRHGRFRRDDHPGAQEGGRLLGSPTSRPTSR